MPRQAMLGNRVRRLRRQHGLTQVAMASRLGISPSYLNLIEHNQRNLNQPLLQKLAECFQVDAQAFSGREEARLLADLTELFGDPVFHDLEVTREELSELAGAAPGACRAMLALYRAYRNAREEVRGLGERLIEDPFLSASNHQLLTLLTSIRSFAEILHDNVDLAAARRQQFVGVLVEESQKLTELVNQLFDFISGQAPTGAAAESPAEEVTDVLHRARNHVPELEDAALALRQELALDAGNAETADKLAARLAGRRAAAAEGTDGQGRHDGSTFAMARGIAMLEHDRLLGELVDRAGVSSEAGQAMYRRVLANYFAGALLMPYEAFLEAARGRRHDIELLARGFRVSFEQVCHRLTTLQRPGREGVPFHFLRVDIAGNISKRYSGSGLRIPRYGGACPRWNVHTAFLRPGQIDRQLGRLPDGTTYLSIAKAVTKPGGGFRDPVSYYAVCLGCEVSFAAQLVYADGLDLSRLELAVPVGVHCRLCEREDCSQRAFPSLIR